MDLCKHGRKQTSCRACYQSMRLRTRPPSECHPDRKEHAAKLCRSCYRRGGRATRANCHPEQLALARGLCYSCYNDLPEVKTRNIFTRRLRKYGIGEQEYNAIWNAQGGKCAICKAPATAVDHDHETGKVRGLLCFKCNSGLGFFCDSPERLWNAITYLRRTT